MRAALRRLAIWSLLAAVLHFFWEVAHLPLYILWDDLDRWRVTRYVLHCLAGDVLIAGATYLLAAIVFRSFDWPVRFPWRAGAFAIVVGLIFTAASEWSNVYVLGGWAYKSTMPLIGGIGLTPLLQWMIVPALTILAVRRIKL